VADNDPKLLIGTWKQLSGTMEEVGSGVVQNSRSSPPNGYVNFSADGRLMLISADSVRNRPMGEVPTAEEAEALFRSLIAYAGSYKVEGNQVSYELDLTWNESWTGTKHVRFWKIEGDILSISTPEMVNPWTGKRSVMRLTFERVKPRRLR